MKYCSAAEMHRLFSSNVCLVQIEQISLIVMILIVFQ